MNSIIKKILRTPIIYKYISPQQSRNIRYNKMIHQNNIRYKYTFIINFIIGINAGMLYIIIVN
jgi:hypothetical protein